jgi:hypothetical protein
MMMYLAIESYIHRKTKPLAQVWFLLYQCLMKTEFNRTTKIQKFIDLNNFLTFGTASGKTTISTAIIAIIRLIIAIIRLIIAIVRLITSINISSNFGWKNRLDAKKRKVDGQKITLPLDNLSDY